MKRYGVMALLSMLINVAVAQTEVSGRVYDNLTSEPIVGAVVMIPHTSNGTITNIKGEFTLTNQNDYDSIMVRVLGYKTEKLRLESRKINLNIALAPSANSMEEIVISASRENRSLSDVPMAITKISATMISDAKPTLLTEVINKVPGVAMLNLNNEQHGMGIRQPMGTSNYFLYMEDGIPLRPMGVFNHNALIEMNLFAISGIEVIKGPASSLYGPEAVGGAINFITQKPTAVFTAKSGIQADNYGYRRTQYGAGGMLGKKLGFCIGGYYAFQKNGWLANSDYNKNSINLRFDYDLSNKTKIILAGSFNDYYSETGGSVDSVAFYSRAYLSTTNFTYRKVRALRTRLSFEHKWNNNNNTTLHFFFRDNSIGQNPDYAIKWTIGKPYGQGQVNLNSLTSRGFILQHTFNIPVLKSKIIGGISLDNSPNTYNAHQIDLIAHLRDDGLSVQNFTIDKERPDIRIADYSAMLWNYAGYAQAEINPVKSLFITLGGRYDVMSFTYHNALDNSSGSKSFKQFSPKAGVNYRIGSSAVVYANYAKGFSPPGLTTIFASKPNTVPVEFHYDLAPAQFINYELGGRSNLIKNKLDMDIALYYMAGKNELLNVRQPDNSFDYRSAGKTTHKGIEYGLTYKPINDLSVRVSGTNAVHRFDEFQLSTKPSDALKDVNGKIMPSAPSWIANSEIMYKPSFIKGMKAGIEWQHMSAWYEDQVNTTKYEDKGAFDIKGISVLNLRLAYNWKGVELFLNIMNMTNELYATNVTRGNAPGSIASYSPAAPRTYVFGLQYNFIKQSSRKNSGY